MDGRWAALSHMGGGARPAKVPDYSTLRVPLPPEQPDAATEGRAGAGGAAAPDDGGGFIVHTVTPSDTLEGLALRYRVTPLEIRVANDLPTSNLATMRELRIPTGRGPLRPPPPKVESREAVMRRFRVTHGLEEAEARYYLEAAEYNEAVAA
jgi:hypothetical protein